MVPSVDPLSTRIVSVSTPTCAATAFRQSSRNRRPFQVTTTMEISGFLVPGSGFVCGVPT
jgi:hypothetical protein